jgi:PPK2 family polyphosphate:nucleotide phosphotransferase
MKLGKALNRYRVEDGKHFRLKDHDPAATGKMKPGPHASEILTKGVARLAELQGKLYAQDRWGILLIFQAMDAAGKDGAIKHVMSGVNPQGVQVYSFKQPSAEELDHDFLWRTNKCLPERGRIGIFNRSYYEEVLVVRVHPEFLEAQHIPEKLITERIWEHRYEDICTLEKHLNRNGFIILKFFLNLSKKEQKRRFLSRLDEPDKNWKFSTADVKERAYWDDYMEAYEEMIRHTSSPDAPWFVVPADNKWYTRLIVSSAIVDALERLDLAYPQIDGDKRKELESARSLLTASGKEKNKAKGKRPDNG